MKRGNLELEVKVRRLQMFIRQMDVDPDPPLLSHSLCGRFEVQGLTHNLNISLSLFLSFSLYHHSRGDA